MRRALVTIGLLLAGGPAFAAGEPVGTPVGSFTTTNTGQPIMPPAGPVQVTVQTVEIPAGGVLPPHRHPYQRYGYILSGRIRVDNLDTGQSTTYGPGEAIIEALGQWHTGTALGDAPVRILVFDQTPPGKVNMERK